MPQTLVIMVGTKLFYKLWPIGKEFEPKNTFFQIWINYYLRQKKRNALEESWFIVARSVQIHSLDVPDFLCVLYDPPAPPWPPSSSLALIHTACWGSCALCLSRLVRRWLKLQWPLPTLITALYDFRIEQTTWDSETVLSSLQSECNRDSVALFV